MNATDNGAAEMPPAIDAFPGFRAIFSQMAAGDGAADRKGSPEALAAVRKAADLVTKSQQNYQPIYGLPAEGAPSPREALLREDCAIVVNEFAQTKIKSQVRILDIGCNAGFISFVLAETFPSTIGFDVNERNISLCNAIRDYTGSPARFFTHNILDLVEAGKADLENLDCVLLLNVVHQLIFARGVPYVKTFIAKLARSVDFIVVELATRADYVKHGKDAELPLIPAEILEECTESTITLLRAGARPVYSIRRRRIGVGEASLDFSERKYSLNPNSEISRKYYLGSNTFTKVFRYSSRQGQGTYNNELKALRSLDGLDATPKPLHWETDAVAGRICMQRLYGTGLDGSLPRMKPAQKPATLREVIRIGAALASRGLYQNDFACHNFMILSDGSLRMVDLEQAFLTRVRDPFGQFLWLAHYVLNGSVEGPGVNRAARLVLPKDSSRERLDRDQYPPLDEAALTACFGPELTAVIAQAHTTDLPWLDFIRQADATLPGRTSSPA